MIALLTGLILCVAVMGPGFLIALGVKIYFKIKDKDHG